MDLSFVFFSLNNLTKIVMKKTTFKSIKSIMAARLVSKKMSFKSQPKFAGWRAMLLLSIIGIVGCNSELNLIQTL